MVLTPLSRGADQERILYCLIFFGGLSAGVNPGGSLYLEITLIMISLQ